MIIIFLYIHAAYVADTSNHCVDDPRSRMIRLVVVMLLDLTLGLLCVTLSLDLLGSTFVLSRSTWLGNLSLNTFPLQL